MHVYRKAIVRFGRFPDNPEGVTIPIGLSTAISDATEIEFKTLHAKCNTPIAQQKFCPHCEEAADELLAGYEIAKGQFVTFTKEEIEAIKPERSPFIDVTKFVPREQVTPMMVSKHVYLIPSQLKEQDYGALYQVLAEENTAGIGSQSLFGKEHPCAVYAFNGVLVMATLNLAEQMVFADFSPDIPSQEVKTAMGELVELVKGELVPEKDLTSSSKSFLLSIIRAKEEGLELPDKPTTEAREPVDLMASLKASVAAAKRAKKPVRAKKGAK